MTTRTESRSFKGDAIHANQNLLESPHHTRFTQEDQLQQLIRKIKGNMASKSREGDQVQELVMIDAIQRLGLQYYFQDDINATLKMSRDIEECGGNLHDVALRFRLLRQAGYDVQADTLSKFKNKEGKFKQELEQDTKGLLSLFEASQLSIPGDDILEEAADFTWDLLKTTTLKSVEKSEIAMIRNTLNNPCHKSLPKLTAKNQLHNFDTLIKFLHYDYCFGMHQWLKDIKDLATIDINMAQITFKYETTKVSRWWKELRMAEELELARHQPVKWHMWSCVALPSPDKAEIRTELTKMISFIYLIDDIFDVYGKVEELTLFTEAVNRWEYANVEELLPTYMKMCLKALYDTIDEMSESIYIKHGWNPKDVLHKAWAELCNAFLVEARWFDSKHLPTTEEYLKNGIVSSGVYVVFASLFCLLDESKDSKCANLGNSHPDIVTFVGTLLRLWDDLGSAKDENKEGHDGSFLACYMNEHPGSSDDTARDYVIAMISDAWKSLNEKCLSHSPFSADFNTAFLNLSRMIPIMYKYDDDNHRLPNLEKHMKSLLCE